MIIEVRTASSGHSRVGLRDQPGDRGATARTDGRADRRTADTARFSQDDRRVPAWSKRAGRISRSV